MTAEEAAREAPLRQEVVRRGRFSAWVEGELPDALRRGVFSFYVTAEGVFIGDDGHGGAV